MRPERLRDRLAFSIGVHSRAVRRAILALPAQSRLRRELLLRFAGLFYLRFNRTGRNAVPRPVLAPDAELIQTDAFIDTTGTFYGREGVDPLMEELYEGFDAIYFEPRTAIVPSPDRLLLLLDAKTVSSGLETNQSVAHLYDLRGGFITRMTVFWEQTEALEAIGLSE